MSENKTDPDVPHLNIIFSFSVLFADQYCLGAATRGNQFFYQPVQLQSNGLVCNEKTSCKCWLI